MLPSGGFIVVEVANTPPWFSKVLAIFALCSIKSSALIQIPECLILELKIIDTSKVWILKEEKYKGRHRMCAFFTQGNIVSVMMGRVT